MAKTTFYGLAFCILCTAFGELNKNLGEICDSDRDCSISYSFCSENNKCECIDGFQKNEAGFCQSEKLSCPNFVIGNNLVEQVVGSRCVVSYQLSEPGIHHNCSENEFCYTHVKSKPAETGSLTFVGHCCPKPVENAKISLICPMTVGHNGTCPDLSRFPADMAIPPEFQSTCPRTTHDCISVDSSISSNKICCPLPCRGLSSHFEIDGRCYDTALPGQPCNHTSQCGGKSKCKLSETGEKKCTCESSSDSTSSDFYCSN